jgi:hypothetical protein
MNMEKKFKKKIIGKNKQLRRKIVSTSVYKHKTAKDFAKIDY